MKIEINNHGPAKHNLQVYVLRTSHCFYWRWLHCVKQQSLGGLCKMFGPWQVQKFQVERLMSFSLDQAVVKVYLQAEDNHSWDSFTRVRSKAGMLTTARTRRTSVKNVLEEGMMADRRNELGQVLPHDKICGQGKENQRIQNLLSLSLTYKFSWKQAPVLFISFVSGPLPFHCAISTPRTMHVSSVS